MGQLTTWLAVGLGGAAGSMARHGVNVLTVRLAPHLSVPYATFAVNVVGCFVIGLLASLLSSGRIAMTTDARAFVFVGILGGFTTFSTFGLDTLTLLHTGLRTTAIWNVVGQVALGLLAVYLGIVAGER
jgi:CrcB protein